MALFDVFFLKFRGIEFVDIVLIQSDSLFRYRGSSAAIVSFFILVCRLYVLTVVTDPEVFKRQNNVFECFRRSLRDGR